MGEWNLGSVDHFIPCNYEGASGKRDLFVHNTNWFGLMRAVPTPIVTLPRVTTAVPAGAPVDEEAGGGGVGGGIAGKFAATAFEETAAQEAYAGGVATAESAAAAPALTTTTITAPILAFGDPNLTLQRLYYLWIHNYRHGRNW